MPRKEWKWVLEVAKIESCHPVTHVRFEELEYVRVKSVYLYFNKYTSYFSLRVIMEKSLKYFDIIIVFVII